MKTADAVLMLLAASLLLAGCVSKNGSGPAATVSEEQPPAPPFDAANGNKSGAATAGATPFATPGSGDEMPPAPPSV